MKTKPCYICQRIKDIKDKKNIHFVKELKTGYVVLCDLQLFKGYTIFLSKVHKKELYELDKEFKVAFLNQMSLVAEAVGKAFNPLKINYELLGNTDSHVHWHLIPRYGDDPDPGMPIWSLGRKILSDPLNKPGKEILKQLKAKLKIELDKIIREDKSEQT